MTTEQDKRAILARRALLVTTALTSFSCAPPGPTGTAEAVTLSGQSPERQPTATTASASAKDLPQLPAWEERLAKAPGRVNTGVLPEKSKEGLVWRWGRIDAALDAVKAVWLGEPELCDANRPECRDAWRSLGAKLKSARDALRAMSPGLCGGALAPTSLENHVDRYARFVSETLDLAFTHWTERAAAQGILAEQEWQKSSANAMLVPPMPCLSCAPSERSSLSRAVEFAAGTTTLSAEERQAIEVAVQSVDKRWYFEIWGHAASSEATPVELAAQRAKAVEAELVRRGVDGRRILIVSAGAELAGRPLAEIVIINR